MKHMYLRFLLNLIRIHTVHSGLTSQYSSELASDSCDRQYELTVWEELTNSYGASCIVSVLCTDSSWLCLPSSCHNSSQLLFNWRGSVWTRLKPHCILLVTQKAVGHRQKRVNGIMSWRMGTMETFLTSKKQGPDDMRGPTSVILLNK